MQVAVINDAFFILVANCPKVLPLVHMDEDKNLLLGIFQLLGKSIRLYLEYIVLK